MVIFLGRILSWSAMGLTGLFLLSFLFNQTYLFLKLKRQYTEQLQHDLYALHTICLKDDVRQSLGERNAAMCRQLEDDVLVSPSMRAVRDVLNQTYLCGSVPCTEYIRDFLSLVYIDWMTSVILIMLAAPLCLRFGLNWFNRNHTPSSTNNSNSIYRLNSGLPFDSLSHDSTYYLSARPHHQYYISKHD